MMVLSGLSLWTRSSYSDCKRSSPRNHNKFSRYSAASLELTMSQRDLLNNYSSASSNYSNQQGTTEKRDEVLSKIGAQDMDTSGY